MCVCDGSGDEKRCHRTLPTGGEPELKTRVSIRELLSGPVARTPSSQGRGPGLTSGRGTRSHMLQLKISPAVTKTQCSQINRRVTIRRQVRGIRGDG